VFVADGAALEQSLERNLYGMSGKSTALRLAAGRLVYTPTSRDDHLATKFFDIGAAGEDRDVGVRLTIRMPDGAVGRCQAAVQTADYVIVGRASCRTAAGLEIALPARTQKFRVLLVSGDHRRADLPAEMRLELLERPRSGS
jgi:hypothetical protein